MARKARKKGPTAEDYASARLLSYAAYQYPSYQIGRHHKRIAAELERVERGEIDRLIITIPPRHGKSMIASEFFPAWYLGRNPDKYIIAASYAQELADDFGRKVRNQMASPEFAAIFPSCKLAADSTSAKRFATAAGGSYFAVGVGGPVTGRGAHILLIDDPIKNREDADSELYRKKMRDWYTSTAYTRLMPGGAVIVIQTRWHEDDLAGWLLAEGKDDWTVLNLPAIQDGKALWPEQYPLDVLHRIKSSIGARDWSALYQQDPTPDDGDFFHRDWFRRYDIQPAQLRTYITADYAVTDGDGDYTELGVWGVDPYDDLYALDWWSGQATADVWIDKLLDLCKIYKPMDVIGESGPIRRAIEPFLGKRMIERRVYSHLVWLASVRDKPSRARAFQGRASMGKVYLPKGDWADELLTQLLRFPAGKYDDKVDVCSLMGRHLDRTYAANVPEKKETKTMAERDFDIITGADQVNEGTYLDQDDIFFGLEDEYGVGCEY